VKEVVQTPRERLDGLMGRANFQASAHAMLHDHYAFWNAFLTYAALIPTAALLLFPLTTGDFVVNALHMLPSAFKIVNAIVALAAFVAVLIQMVWRPDSLAKAHRRAVTHYTDAKFAARRLLENEHIDAMDARILEEKYLDVQGLPAIPEDRFLRLKQRHLQKLSLSKQLDQDPWLPLFRLPWQKSKHN
jgi:hypothetical protein